MPERIKAPEPREPTEPESKRTNTIAAQDERTVVKLTFDMHVTNDDLAQLSAAQIAALFDGIAKVASVKAALSKD